MIDLSAVTYVLVGGVLLGGIYALSAIGISLIFSTIDVLNLAHGNLVMLGAAFTFVVYYGVGGPASGLVGLLVALVAVLVTFAALGGTIERLLIRPILASKDILVSGILVTIGLALVLQDLGGFLLTHDPANISRTTTVALTLQSVGSTVIGGYYLDSSRLVSLVVVSITGLVLYLFFKRTYLGLAMRSISQDRDAAVVVGVDLKRTSLVTFSVGTLFAGFAGLILVIDQTADPVLGLGYTIRLLTIMVLGGTRSPLGAVVGGLLLGVIEFATAELFGAYWVAAVSLLILIVILLVRPTGLTGRT